MGVWLLFLVARLSQLEFSPPWWEDNTIKFQYRYIWAKNDLKSRLISILISINLYLTQLNNILDFPFLCMAHHCWLLHCREHVWVHFSCYCFYFRDYNYLYNYYDYSRPTSTLYGEEVYPGKRFNCNAVSGWVYSINGPHEFVRQMDGSLSTLYNMSLGCAMKCVITKQTGTPTDSKAHWFCHLPFHHFSKSDAKPFMQFSCDTWKKLVCMLKWAKCFCCWL